MYKGIKQIDPQWVTPNLTDANVQDPASMDFYEPTYYVIGGRKYHKSHFIKFVPFPVPNVLKSMYNYFGVSVPERIYEWHTMQRLEVVTQKRKVTGVIKVREIIN